MAAGRHPARYAALDGPLDRARNGGRHGGDASRRGGRRARVACRCGPARGGARRAGLLGSGGRAHRARGTLGGDRARRGRHRLPRAGGVRGERRRSVLRALGGAGSAGHRVRRGRGVRRGRLGSGVGAARQAPCGAFAHPRGPAGAVVNPSGRVEPLPITHLAPPLPGRTVASQTWSDVTMLHWRVPSAEVAALLPDGVAPDEFDGTGWVGLILFRLGSATLFGSPPVPHAGDFVEINVRLYGTDAMGRRGVVFRSLEASRLAAVIAARAAFGLPYFWSRTRMQREGHLLGYDTRRHGGGPSSAVRVRTGKAIRTGALAEFLTARWGMFTRRGRRTVWVPTVHEPWTLHAAEVLSLEDELVAAAGLPGVASRRPDSVLFSPGVSARFGGAARH
ncbi:MAG: DUF2071 domain-containing protein [Microbacteriaceae bacterium]|nr:DUF2071 domain-containing protein [Microbacteriaceae bacterium]